MTYGLTARAADDFTGIYDHTLLNAGKVQADEYAESLAAFFEALSRMPGVGRDYSAVPGVIRANFHWQTVFLPGLRYAYSHSQNPAPAKGLSASPHPLSPGGQWHAVAPRNPSGQPY